MARSLDRIHPVRRTGREEIHHNGHPVGGSLLGFWQWAGSGLEGNTFRGWLAEYLVALDLGIAHGVRSGWIAYDLEMEDGTKVEIKSSAYVQHWKQKGLSTPRFSIRPALGWDPDTDTYTEHPRRASDYYVFCLHKHRDQATLDVLNVSQWTFFVIPTKAIDDKLDSQKSVGVTTLRRIGACEVPFGKIRQTVTNMLGRSK